MNMRRRMVLKGTCMVNLTLAVSGLVAVGIAASILSAPDIFYAGYGIDVAGDATLVNELKAPAGVLLAAGLLMIAGVFRAELTGVALTTASVVYLSYGLARVLSIAMDGVPDSSLVYAASIEIGIGAACLLALSHTHRNLTHHEPKRATQ